MVKGSEDGGRGALRVLRRWSCSRILLIPKTRIISTRTQSGNDRWTRTKQQLGERCEQAPHDLPDDGNRGRENGGYVRVKTRSQLRKAKELTR